MAIRQLETQLRPLLFAKPHVAGPVSLPVSVVVCTRDRADLLDGCLESLRQQDYPQFEIIVVDNASTTDETAGVAARHGATLVRESRPGLDWARNRGIEVARHDIIAFTDDDARPDAGWLAALARRFADPEVQGVTGLVTPLELETRAQLLFEEVYGGMGKGFLPQRIQGRQLDAAARLSTYRVGVGANMAFRRQAIEELGGFDTALDVGTPSHGGGDLDMFDRMLAAGYVLAYEPRALVRHRHRREMGALRRQLRDDGRAFGVYLLKRWQTGDAPRGALLRFALGHWIPWLTGRIVIGLLGRHRLPLTLLWANLQGALGAPMAWISTRRSDRVLRARTARLPVEGIA
jgi:glycosyltransferase involved in cell wall biosynthesis